MGIWTPYTAGFGVGIFSITNPAAPVLITNYYPSPTGNNQFEMGVIRSNIAYFASWSGGGMHILSLTNPAAPVLLARIGNTTGTVTNGHDRVHTLFLERNFLYEADHATPVVKVFDVSNPAVPVFVRNIARHRQRIHQITVVSNRLYTSGWGGHTDIYDVSNVGTQPPPRLGFINSGVQSHSSWPTPDGKLLVSCREIAGGDVRFFDITDPANAVLMLTLTPASMGLEDDTPHNPIIMGNLLFISWYQNGLQIFDITDRTKPVRIGSYDTFPSARTTLFEGNWGVYPFFGLNKILLSDMQTGLKIVDATAVLTATNNYPPLIIAPPVSQTVTQGVSLTFNALVTGSAPSYQWRFNGANIPGATTNAYALANVQPGHGGSYTLVVSNAAGTVVSAQANLSVIIPQIVSNLFSDNFDANSSTNWTLFNASADYLATWAYDYGTYFSSYNGGFIPPAPNTTNGTTRGLRLTVNNTNGVVTGISLYPKSQTFSGKYKLKFDMWMNYNGGPGGGAGSTQIGTYGINHAGTLLNWDSAAASPSDGVWFAASGEGGSTRDYRAYVGNAAGRSTWLSFAASGIAAGGATTDDNSAPYFQSLFPSPAYETPGSPGKHWVQVEISQDTNNVVSWLFNGNLIAQRTNTSAFTNGTVMLGYMDLNSSVANPASDTFVIFDNVRVETSSAIPAPVITSQPQNQSLFPEENASFAVGVVGAAPLTYQWRFNGASIPGATGSTFTRANVQPEDAGAYTVVVANAAGTATSAPAILTLIDSPYVNSIVATPGANSAIITWNTDLPADSQVEFAIVPVGAGGRPANGTSSPKLLHAEYGNASYIDPALVLSHSILLTALLPDTRYGFQVSSHNGTNHYASSGYFFNTAGTLIVTNPNVLYGGTWNGSTNGADKYSTNYQVATTVLGAANATAFFIPTITTAGKYDVYTWYPQGSNRPVDAAYSISYNGGSQTVAVDQTTNGGSWRLLAAGRDFAKGSSGFVRVSNNSASAGKQVAADAVRWVYAANQDPPPAGTVPAWWANYYFGTNINAALDPDGDGYSTAMEYILGTVPTDFNSRLTVVAQPATNGLQVIFSPHYEDREYQLLASTNLTSPSWRTLTNEHADLNAFRDSVFTVTNRNSSYYRLSVQLPP